jgi:DNA-binding NarL/FixJ family response regulator/class 3 adenylate cyclase
VAGTTTVVFTDLTDSSRVLATLGDDGYAAVFAAHASLLRGAAERHAGRVTKQLGDGVLAVFGSAGEAVLAAVEMQQVVERAAHGPGAPAALGLRIGVNSGDVVDADDDIFGNVLVVARRLCDAAQSGQILVADVVRVLAGNRPGLTFEPAGELVLKGIPSPVSACAVAWSPAPAEPLLRVMIADDAALIRSGVARLLAESGFAVTAELGDAAALLDAVDREPPDLVITDIRMPPTNTDEGLRAAAAIRERHPGVAVLVLSQYVEARNAGALLDGRRAGIGYLLKERVSALDEFVAACREVAAGGSVIDPIVTEQLLHRRRHDVAIARLTERERDVLALMAQGRSNTAIASELHLGGKTVESHVRSIFQKLDLEETVEGNRRVQAVLHWLQTT